MLCNSTNAEAMLKQSVTSKINSQAEFKWVNIFYRHYESFSRSEKKKSVPTFIDRANEHLKFFSNKNVNYKN